MSILDPIAPYVGLIKAGLVLALICGVSGGFYVMYEKVIDANDNLKIADANTAQAEKDRDTAITAANANALLVAQQSRDADETIDQLTKEKTAAVARANRTSSMLAEIQNAPTTSDCVRSPVIGDTLERLRDARAARLADAGQGAGSTAAEGASEPAVVRSGPGSASQGQ